MAKQKAAGCWDYDGRAAGDASISQYAVLGLWEAENAGVRIAPSVWDNAAGWFLSVQWRRTAAGRTTATRAGGPARRCR